MILTILLINHIIFGGFNISLTFCSGFQNFKFTFVIFQNDLLTQLLFSLRHLFILFIIRKKFTCLL